MHFYVEKSLLLGKIPYNTYIALKIKLELENTLENIEKFCPEIYNKIKPTYHLSFQTPIENLIANLTETNCTIEDVAYLLRTSKLYDALSVLLTEPLKSIVEPVDQIIQRGKKLLLKYEVWGIPQPSYRWYRNNELLIEKNSSTLNYDIYTPALEGTYYCETLQVVEGKENILQSNTVTVETKEEPCVVIKKLREELIVHTTPVPQEVVLEVIVDGYPVPEIQWIHNNKSVDNVVITQNSNGETKSFITIFNEVEYVGEYHCIVKSTVLIDMRTKFKVVNELISFPVTQKRPANKVAILFCNGDYANHTNLRTPTSDVKLLENYFKCKNFSTISLSNLKLNEMQMILKCTKTKYCLPDSIVFFYFTGHGFELNEKYLMPSDVSNPEKILKKECIAEDEILSCLLERKPMLLITIFDMCLKKPHRANNPKIYEELHEKQPFVSNRNLIQGYSTTTGSSAFEGNFENSPYCHLLNKHLTRERPILQSLFNVNIEFNSIVNISSDPDFGLQAPFISFNVAEDFHI